MSELTAALKLPGESLILASRSSVLSQPAITDREAALTLPRVVMNRLFKFSLASLRLRVTFTNFLVQTTGSSLSGNPGGSSLSRHPDCLKLPESVFEPNRGQNMMWLSLSSKCSKLTSSSVKSWTRRPEHKSKSAAR